MIQIYHIHNLKTAPLTLLSYITAYSSRTNASSSTTHHQTHKSVPPLRIIISCLLHTHIRKQHIITTTQSPSAHHPSMPMHNRPAIQHKPRIRLAAPSLERLVQHFSGRQSNGLGLHIIRVATLRLWNSPSRPTCLTTPCTPHSQASHLYTNTTYTDTIHHLHHMCTWHQSQTKGTLYTSISHNLQNIESRI